MPKDSFLDIDIFEKFKHGTILFPDEPIANVSKQIINSKELNFEIARQICSESELNETIIFNKIKDKGFVLSDINWSCCENMRIEINDKIDRCMLPFLDRIGLRCMSSIEIC